MCIRDSLIAEDSSLLDSSVVRSSFRCCMGINIIHSANSTPWEPPVRVRLQLRTQLLTPADQVRGVRHRSVQPRLLPLHRDQHSGSLLHHHLLTAVHLGERCHGFSRMRPQGPQPIRRRVLKRIGSRSLQWMISPCMNYHPASCRNASSYSGIWRRSEHMSD